MTPHKVTSDRQVGNQGFALIELLAVLLIVAMATGVVGITLSGRQTKTSLARFATDTARLLSQVQQDALVTGTSRTVTFDLERRTIDYGRTRKIHAIPPEFDIKILVGQELIAAGGQIPVIFFSEGGSTGIEVTMHHDSGPAVKLQTSWLTGLTRVLGNADQ